MKALNSPLQTYQILTNDDQMLILCLSCFKTTVLFFSKDWLYTKKNVLKKILLVLYYSLVGQFDIFSYSSFTYFHIYTHTEKCGRNETLYGSKKVKVTSFFLFFLFFWLSTLRRFFFHFFGRSDILNLVFIWGRKTM